MVDTLAAAVGCDTTYPPGDNYAAFADLMEAAFAGLGGSVQRVRVPAHLWERPGVWGERINLIIQPDLGAADLPEAMIYVHVDTAPVGDGWVSDPFELVQQGDRLIGRGAADMKGTIAAIANALARLAERNAPLAFRPTIAFCTDEEGGLYPGVRYLDEQGLIPPVVINLNGSAEPRVWAGCLGSLTLKIKGTGEAAHSGSGAGINAFEEMLPCLMAISDLGRQLRDRVTDLPSHPDANTPLTARLSITELRAGEGAAAIPGFCTVTLNRRYLPEEVVEEVRREIDAVVADVLDQSRLLSWTITEIGHLPPVRNDEGPVSGRWDRARAAAYDLPLSAFQRYGSGSSSDFGWITPAPGGTFVLGGLARPDRNIHGANEFTTFGDIFALSRALELFFDRDFDATPDLKTLPTERIL